MVSHSVRQKKNNDDRGEVPMNDPQSHPASGLEDDRDSRLILWFERWREPMRRWLASRSSVPASDLDDMTQEAFLRLMRYSKDAAITNPQSYLFRIATNVANEWRERARNSLPHADTWLEDLQVEAGDEPENAVARTLVHKRVQREMQRLPPRQHEALALHINDGLTYKQIARRMGLTPRIVRRDLAQAYSYLRCKLDVEDVEK
jgi:RNA polymerase sigma factor (sigma-70 family)